MRIFLDANILFSAAKSEGAVRRLLTLLLDADHECWVDGFVLAEARRNLVAKAPAGVEWLDSSLVRLRVGEKQVEVTGQGELALPEKDRPVLAAAIRHRCQALVTGDRSHFGSHFGETLQGLTIYSPRSLAEALLSE